MSRTRTGPHTAKGTGSTIVPGSGIGSGTQSSGTHSNTRTPTPFGHLELESDMGAGTLGIRAGDMSYRRVAGPLDKDRTQRTNKREHSRRFQMLPSLATTLSYPATSQRLHRTWVKYTIMMSNNRLYISYDRGGYRLAAVFCFFISSLISCLIRLIVPAPP